MKAGPGWEIMNIMAFFVDLFQILIQRRSMNSQWRWNTMKDKWRINKGHITANDDLDRAERFA